MSKASSVTTHGLSSSQTPLALRRKYHQRDFDDETDISPSTTITYDEVFRRIKAVTVPLMRHPELLCNLVGEIKDK